MNHARATSIPTHERPCASAGLISYRYRGRYGFIMIGAWDDADALREAGRSTDDVSPDSLERWDGSRYAPVGAPVETPPPAQWVIHDNGGVGGFHARGPVGKPYTNAKRARTRAERLNLEYGAHRFTVIRA